MRLRVPIVFANISKAELNMQSWIGSDVKTLQNTAVYGMPDDEKGPTVLSISGGALVGRGPILPSI